MRIKSEIKSLSPAYFTWKAWVDALYSASIHHAFSDSSQFLLLIIDLSSV